MDRGQLEALDRESLVARATAAGIRRARVLTRPELIDELLRLDPNIDASALKKSRGFFGRARDLLSRVVERGLHLPDAAERLREALSTPLPEVPRPEPQAVPTVTLAEIYAAQGHKQRAIETLERVLEREPEHGTARALLEKLTDAAYVPPKDPLPPEPEYESPGAALQGEEEGERTAEKEVGEDDITLDLAADELQSLAPTISRTPECVAIPSTEGRAYVWWRVWSELLEGPFVVRVVILKPTWDGPVEEVRDFRLDPAAGELVVSDLPEPAVVRVAVGWMRGEELVPVAHSPALETEARDPEALVRWTIEGAVPVVLDDPRAGTIKRAVDGARRALGR